MEDYKKLYYRLFNVYSEVLEQLERQNYGLAKEILIKAQQEAENLFLEEEQSA